MSVGIGWVLLILAWLLLWSTEPRRTYHDLTPSHRRESLKTASAWVTWARAARAWIRSKLVAMGHADSSPIGLMPAYSINTRMASRAAVVGA